jgi:hypothetical protein
VPLPRRRAYRSEKQLQFIRYSGSGGPHVGMHWWFFTVLITAGHRDAVGVTNFIIKRDWQPPEVRQRLAHALPVVKQTVEPTIYEQASDLVSYCSTMLRIGLADGKTHTLAPLHRPLGMGGDHVGHSQENNDAG